MNLHQLSLDLAEPATPKQATPVPIDPSHIVQGGIKGVEINVTPELAKQWLALNVGNRRMSEITCQDYIEHLRNGTWDDANGDTITFDEHGNLMDGQHRLTAVVRSGISLKTLVTWGVKRAKARSKDQPNPRKAREMLDMIGVSNSTDIAAALRLICHHEKTGRFEGNTSRFAAHTNAAFERHVTIVESVPHGRKLKVERIATATIGITSHYLFAQRDREAADTFIDTLATGLNLQAGSPIAALRTRFIRSRDSRHTKIHNNEVMALMIKAWNAWRAGRPMQVARWNPAVEEMPVIE